MTSICTTPIYELKELNNLFIEMTSKNCNQRCKSCYIDFPLSKNVKDFISAETIKEALNDTTQENLQCIYLTGAEPMMHNDFNSILRLCLKRCNVCICTNGSFLNEKKIRFLSKVENEGENQIFFRLSLTHFNEIDNDNVKYRGNFRQTIFALKTLSVYNFNSVLAIQNFYELSSDLLKEMFIKIFSENNILNTELQINPSFPFYEQNCNISSKTDCMYGRCLGTKGVYSCPFLSNDFRGRVGSSFKNYSKTFRAETDFCALCSQKNNFISSIG